LLLPGNVPSRNEPLGRRTRYALFTYSSPLPAIVPCNHLLTLFPCHLLHSTITSHSTLSSFSNTTQSYPHTVLPPPSQSSTTMHPKYASLALLSLAAAQFFDPMPNPISIAIPTGTVSSLSPLAACLADCAKDDTSCQDTCAHAPSQDAAQIAAAKECEAACPQGDSGCIQRCVSGRYDASTETVAAGGTATSGSATNATAASDTTAAGGVVVSESSASLASGQPSGGAAGTTTGSAGG